SKKAAEPRGRRGALGRLLQSLPGPRDVGVTPAMAAGLTDHIWSIAELLSAALDAPPAPVAPLTPQHDPEPIAVGLSAKQAGNMSDWTRRWRGLRIVKGGWRSDGAID